MPLTYTASNHSLPRSTFLTLEATFSSSSGVRVKLSHLVNPAIYFFTQWSSQYMFLAAKGLG